MAYGVIDAARVLGLKVPEELSVAGFDDSDESAVFVPALTTVAQPMLDLGLVAARYLLDVLNSSKPPPLLRKQLPPRLVPRSSTAPPQRDQRATSTVAKALKNIRLGED